MFGGDVDIDVTVLGDHDPELTIVGGIHGDEPSGIRAVRRVIEREPELQRSVQFIVANPPAAVAHRRYLDVDMNRVFPGSSDSTDRERRLAAQLSEAVEGTTVLSLHSTHSSVDPIAFVSKDHPIAQGIAAVLPVEHVVNHDPVVEGAFTSCQRVVSVEAGRQLTDAATHNAARIVRAFLRQTDALPEDIEPGSPDYYTLTEEVAKPSKGEEYQLYVDNFTRVEEGETYAATEDAEYVANEPFHPVLMSEAGYEEIFGYKGEKVGETLEDARDAWPSPPEATHETHSA